MNKQLIKKILTEVFNYKNFRPGQESIINKILQGQDVFVIMPTGAGKSICFQIPALLLEGVTIVISPLISLMRDQVSNLQKLNISAVFLNRSITTGQLKKAMKDVIKGVYKIVYIAPERLESESFLEFIKQIKVSLVVVDEAHCVTHWGYGFRPSYLKIASFFEILTIRPIFAAFTATASVSLAHEIVKLLKLKNPFFMTIGFDRPNLFFDVFEIEEQFKIKFLLKIFKNICQGNTIVYCQTRKIVDFVFAVLKKRGFKVVKYHAGLSQEARRRNQNGFLTGEFTVLVATNAFGMGIDKKNVRNVVHYNMPKNLEDYYQESGRAGRDGKKALCIMLYSKHDVEVNKLFIEKAQYASWFTDAQVSEFKRQNYEKLNDIVLYCKSDCCYKNQILKYFGEENQLENCHFCGNCSRNFIDFSNVARCIIRCVQEFEEKLFAKEVLKIVKGSLFLSKRLKKSVSFKTLRETPLSHLKICLKELIFRGYVVQKNELKLTSKAYSFISNVDKKFYVKTTLLNGV